MTTFTPPTPATLPPTRGRGGILAAALAPPEGWEFGLAVPFYGCGEPILRDKCVTATDEAHRPNVAEFPAFPIEQGSTCSTLSRLDHAAFARGRLDATTEWALGRQLQADIVGTGAPALDDAISLGVVTAESPGDAVVSALAQLEAAAAQAGFGTMVWIHATPAGATWMASQHLIDPNGFTAAGSRVVVSPGYIDPDESPPAPEVVRFWATGPVWAAIDAPSTMRAVDHRTNDDTAYALRTGIVAFDPCVLLSIDADVSTDGGGVIPGSNSLAFAGEVDNSGNLVLGPAGWTAERLETGVYRVTHNLGTENYSVAVNPMIKTETDFYAAAVTATTETTFTYELYSTNAGGRHDAYSGFVMVVNQ